MSSPKTPSESERLENHNWFEAPKTGGVSGTRVGLDRLLSYLATTTLVGMMVGCAVCTIYMFYLVRPWGDPMLKGDGRMDKLIFAASYVLPVCVLVAMAISAVVFVRSCFRLNLSAILWTCLILFVMLMGIRPAPARVVESGVPLDTLVLNSMTFFVLFVVVITLGALALRGLRRSRTVSD